MTMPEVADSVCLGQPGCRSARAAGPGGGLRSARGSRCLIAPTAGRCSAPSGATPAPSLTPYCTPEGLDAVRWWRAGAGLPGTAQGEGAEQVWLEVEEDGWYERIEVQCGARVLGLLRPSGDPSAHPGSCGACGGSHDRARGVVARPSGLAGARVARRSWWWARWCCRSSPRGGLAGGQSFGREQRVAAGAEGSAVGVGAAAARSICMFLLLHLCIRYPALGIPVTLAVMGFFVARAVWNRADGHQVQRSRGYLPPAGMGDGGGNEAFGGRMGGGAGARAAHGHAPGRAAFPGLAIVCASSDGCASPCRCCSTSSCSSTVAPTRPSATGSGPRSCPTWPRARRRACSRFSKRRAGRSARSWSAALSVAQGGAAG